MLLPRFLEGGSRGLIYTFQDASGGHGDDGMDRGQLGATVVVDGSTGGDRLGTLLEGW